MTNVKSGERVQLKARDVNAWNKVSEAYRAGQFDHRATPHKESNSPVIITIQNKTGKHVGIFSVLALGESVKLTGTEIDKAMPQAVNGAVIFEGNVPSGSESETVCITLSSAGQDNITQAVLIGVVGCVVNLSDTAHRYAKPVSGDVLKLQSSESGVIKILNPVETKGDQFCYVLLGGGGGGGTVQQDEITVPVFYPARQWTNKMPIDGSENKRLWSESRDPHDSYGTWFMNACGLTNEGKTPLPVMEWETKEGKTIVQQKKDGDGNVLYYRDVKLSVKEKFVQPEEGVGRQAQWRLHFVETDTEVPVLAANEQQTTGFVSSYLWLSYLATLAGRETELKQVDFSDQWETTTNPEKALKSGHQVIAPHNIVGYTLWNECTYRPSENKTVRYEGNGTRALVATGTQWINTGVTFNPATHGEFEMHIDHQPVNRSTRNGYGAVGTNRFYFVVAAANSSTSLLQIGIGGTSNINIPDVTEDLLRRYFIVKHVKSTKTSTVTRDGVTVLTNTSATLSATTFPLWLFGGSNNAAGTSSYAANWLGNVKLFGAKFIQDGVLLRDFVPVPQGSTQYSSTPAPSNCLWDHVTQAYFTNSGTGTFGIEGAAAVSLSIPVIVPIIKQEFKNVRIFAEVELDLYEMTEGEPIENLAGINTKVKMRKLETIEDVLNVEQESIWAPLPAYRNDKPVVKDTTSIENNCTGTPLLGLWKDGVFPQLLYAENIPYGYCIPLKTIATLIKVTCNDCSPAYNTNKYTVALDELEGNKFYSALNVDFKPSIRCPADTPSP